MEVQGTAGEAGGMNTTLSIKARKARKPYKCDYCCEVIEKGEVYDDATYVYDNKIYNWRTHQRCSRVASAIWDYVDPDEGMSDQEFMDGCQDICRNFICPDCPEWNKEYDDCDKDLSYCIDRMDDFFKGHMLYKAGRINWTEVWKCKELPERPEVEE